MARSSECTERHAQKVIDSAGIVRDAMLRQPSLAHAQVHAHWQSLTLLFFFAATVEK